MPKFTSTTTIKADRAERYHAALCDHFSRKVSVDKLRNGSCVHFAMGECTMSATDKELCFVCETSNVLEMRTLKFIMSSNITKYGELRDTEVNWVDS